MSNDYFPADYADSRRRFLERVRKLAEPVQTGTWPVPGQNDSDLAVDFAYLPATDHPERLFVMTSGIHGLEAYAGSAIQSMFLDEILPRVNRSRVGFLIVHSMNPFGFKHHRRATESNVNLNRNFSSRPELYRTPNEASFVLNERFIPREPLAGLVSKLISQLKTVNGTHFFDDVPMDEFLRGVAIGQYKTPAHLEYGGSGPEPQTRALTEKLREIMPLYRDIILTDLHTGLGHRGRLHLLTGDTADSVHEVLFAELFDQVRDREVYEFTPASEEGFYETHGALNNIFPELAGPQQRICALTMEFGTLGHDDPAQFDGMNRWLLEHQGSLYGYATPELEAQVRADYLDKFFPDDSTWRRQILDQARELFTRVLQRARAL